MPRPRQDEVLRNRSIKLTDKEWQVFKDMGGAAWLRKFLGGRPARYWEVFRK